MKKLPRFIPLVLITVMAMAPALDIYDDISAVIRSGNSKEIANYFDSSIDLTISNQEDVYSKAQAELILKDFFSRNIPKSFTILHKGKSKVGILYGIGSLVTTNGSVYRTTFFIKQVDQKFLINELRFEKE